MMPERRASIRNIPRLVILRANKILITYQAHLATAGRRKLGFRRPRNHVSGRLAVDSRSPTSSRGRLHFVSAAQMSLVRNQEQNYLTHSCEVFYVDIT